LEGPYNMWWHLVGMGLIRGKLVLERWNFEVHLKSCLIRGVAFDGKGLIKCGDFWWESALKLVRGNLLYWNDDIFNFVYLMADLKNKVKCYSVAQSVVYIVLLLYFTYIWLIDWCFTPTLAIFQYIMAWTNFIIKLIVFCFFWGFFLYLFPLPLLSRPFSKSC
jgi:hypothetical protein